VNEFQRDDGWQRQMRDRILAPSFYSTHAAKGRYVFLDKGKLATEIQRLKAVDTIVQGRENVAVCIEEKIVRWPKKRKNGYTAFTLETMSCTVPGREKAGWMKYGEADYLLYCFSDPTETALRCFLIDFPKLKAWFWKELSMDPCKWLRTITEQINHSECCVVPFEDVQANVQPCREYLAIEPSSRRDAD
jgi:hypothetical protein